MSITRTALIELYRTTILNMSVIATAAYKAGERAEGGALRASKGNLVETMAKHMVKMAWAEAGGPPSRLEFGTKKSFRVDIQSDYVSGLPEKIRKYVEKHVDEHFYRPRVDVKAFIDGELVLGIECKSYTENAMLKRILVDFRLMRTIYPNLVCCLLQLENQLGGNYSNPLDDPQYGSPSSHTLMSYFPDVRMHVITLLEGARDVEQPIHKPEYFKELYRKHLDHAIGQLRDLLAPFARKAKDVLHS